MCLIFTVMIGIAFTVTTLVIHQLHHEEILDDVDVDVGNETVVDYQPWVQVTHTPGLGALMAVIGPDLGDELDQDDEDPEESVCTFISGPPCVQSLVTFLVVIVVGTLSTYLFVVFLKFTCCCFVDVIERIKLIFLISISFTDFSFAKLEGLVQISHFLKYMK